MRYRENFSSVLLRLVTLVFLSRYSVLVIGDLVQSCGDILGKFSEPPCLASIYLVNPLYILLSRYWSLRAFMSCSPIHVM